MCKLTNTKINYAKALQKLMPKKTIHRYRGYPIEVTEDGFVIFGSFFSSKELAEEFVDTRIKEWDSNIKNNNHDKEIL